MLLKFNFMRCKETLTVKDHGGIVIREERCALQRDHKGFHRNKNISAWANVEMASKRMDNEGGSL